MPGPTSKGVFARRVAPFAPVALALLAQGSLLGGGAGGAGAPAAAPTAADTQPATCSGDIEDSASCHSQYPTGCSAAAGYDGYLNYLKNQLIDPGRTAEESLAPADLVALDGRLPDGLARTNHGDLATDLEALGDGKIVTLTGYLYYAKKGGVESSNCGLKELEDIDFHIGIGPQAAEGGQVDSDAVIVEMTPHWRARFKPNWTLDLLHGALGRQVRITGQLLVDNEHDDPKDDCALEGHGSKCWRASVWEVHPVTRFEVCGTEPCSPGSDAGWVDLESFQAGAAGESVRAAPAAAPAAATTPAAAAPAAAVAPAAPKTP